jgi:hypothetical protein
MQESQVLKSINPDVCPHCGKVIYTSLNVIIPQIIGIFSKEQIMEAKKEIKEELMKIKWADEKDKEEIIRQLDDEKNLLDASDKEGILSQISKEQTEKLSKLNVKKDEKENKNTNT